MLKAIFTWWNGATIGAWLTISKSSTLVGEDEAGNRYYEARTNKGSYDQRKRRYVIYKGYAEASKISPDWHGWMHYTFDEPPTVEPFKLKVVGKAPSAQPHRHHQRLAAPRLDRARRRASPGHGRLPGLEAEVAAMRVLRLGAAACLAILAGAAAKAQTPAGGDETTQLLQNTPPAVHAAAPPDAAPASDDAPDVSDEAPAKPVAPAKRPRRNAAVLQALDKVTAETMRFEAQVNQPVRYKDLVFTVHACEENAPDEAEPGASPTWRSIPSPRPRPGWPPRRPVSCSAAGCSLTRPACARSSTRSTTSG